MREVKDSRQDIIVDMMLDRFRKVKEEIVRQSKGVKPYRREAMSNDELFYIYDNASLEDMQYVLDTYGRDAVNQRLFEVNQLRRRK